MRGHFIKTNDRTERMQHAVWVDTETNSTELDPDTLEHRLFQGWAAYSRLLKSGNWSEPEWFRFERLEDFWEWTESKCRVKTRLYVFCHNSNFDYPVLDAFGYLPEHGWKPDRLVIEAPPTIIRVKKKGRTLVLLDTLNWFAVPLRTVGKMVGLEKLTMPAANDSQEVWDTYNKRDVEIIMCAMQAWSGMIAEHDLGGFQPTLAGQSFAAWRHRFMDHKILIDNNEEALSCSRACYHGGRTEAFHIGTLTDSMTLLDVNSMYPYVMEKYQYPTVLAFHSRHMTPDKLKYLLRHHLACAHVNITVDQPAIGVYHDDKFVFPVGTFDAHLSTPEIQWVQKHGTINKVYEVSAYRKAPIFRRFVRHMYRWRLEAKAAGNMTLAHLIKILMNSLYGKFGQRGFRYEDEEETTDLSLDTWTEVNIDTHEVERYRRLMGKVQRLHRESESANSHPAIAAHVTAYARMFLWELIEVAGIGNVFYCDTDGLLVNDVGLQRLRDYLGNDALGALKVEGKYTWVEIYGAKDYVFGDKYRCKGVRPSALWTSPHDVEQDKWSGLKGMLRAGRLDAPTTKRVKKHLQRTYDKGHVSPSGRVFPLLLGTAPP